MEGQCLQSTEVSFKCIGGIVLSITIAHTQRAIFMSWEVCGERGTLVASGTNHGTTLISNHININVNKMRVKEELRAARDPSTERRGARNER